ncbi:DNA-binding transcription factor cat8 [Xanthoria calcicola]
MPGILPMKVIRLGTSAQSRIAQACDRCRSKKIRCDGVTPCCTQCANVGFECRTSDKLSRRAFPRGYTESLEERVRSLELEVRELKDLLDERDEKIDILSKIRSDSSPPRQLSSALSPETSQEEKSASPDEDLPQENSNVQHSSSLRDGEPDWDFMGASSGRAFVDSFKTKAKESGKQCPDFGTQTFFACSQTRSTPPKDSPARSHAPKAPPRLLSDQLINVFFQEWAPLFPILHRPTFLNVYTQYVADPEACRNQYSIAQLNLVFCISAQSMDANKPHTESFERQWRDSLEAVLSENTLATLQCLVLAQLTCITRGDYTNLLQYKGLAINLSHRLGLHQSQKRFSCDSLASETRKKVFWTLYTVDCFSAALLGIPKTLQEEDIHTEYPVDIDDENVSERGFQPTLPGESTRLASALALFRGSRILAKVLEELYPASTSDDLSIQKIGSLNEELNAWLSSLPSHLRLQFAQDKPSTKIIGSRSPFLSLAYEYVRTLIHRPAVGFNLGSKASSSIVALADSSKHIIQIVQLLEERRMSFSFCLNKNELLLLSGFGLLFQGLELNRKGKLMQDSQRLVCSVIAILERNAAPGWAEFKSVACAMISVDPSPNSVQAVKNGLSPRRKSDSNMKAPPATKSKVGRKQQVQVTTGRFSTGNINTVPKRGSGERKATAPGGSNQCSQAARSNNVAGVSSAVSDPIGSTRREQSASQSGAVANRGLGVPNLDYFSFSNDSEATPSYPRTGNTDGPKGLMTDEFAGLLNGPALQGPMDGLFSSSDLLGPYMTPPPSTANFDWGTDPWTMPADMNRQLASQSVPSYTEEEMTSGEEQASSDRSNEHRVVAMPSGERIGLEALDVDFGG